MKDKYPWAVNEAKLTRAVQKVNDQLKAENAVLRANGKPEISATEKMVKDTYVSLAGLLREDAPEMIVSVENGVKNVKVVRKAKKK